jgi:hypothetical protein
VIAVVVFVFTTLSLPTPRARVIPGVRAPVRKTKVNSISELEKE